MNEKKILEEDIKIIYSVITGGDLYDEINAGLSIRKKYGRSYNEYIKLETEKILTENPDRIFFERQRSRINYFV